MTTFLVNIDVPDITADDLRCMILDGMGYPLDVDEDKNCAKLAVYPSAVYGVLENPNGTSYHVEVLSAGNPRAGQGAAGGGVT